MSAKNTFALFVFHTKRTSQAFQISQIKHSWRVSGAEAEKDWWLCIKKSLYNRIAGGEGFILFCFNYFIFILLFSFIYFILFCFILFVIFTFNFIYLQVLFYYYFIFDERHFRSNIFKTEISDR